MKKTGFIVGLVLLLVLLVGGLILARYVFDSKVEDVKREIVEQAKDEQVKDEPVNGGVMEEVDDPSFKEGDFESVDDGDDDEKKAIEKQNKERLSQGCFAGKDCIPSIDNPEFVTAGAANFLNDRDWVIGLDRGGIQKAYPLKILNWHEIVNDKVGDEAIAVSFCPLCYTGNAFERVIDGMEVEFGVSGYLINSNLVMYDRYTDSLWEQLTGEAIVGPQLGSKLKKITVSTMPWPDWVAQHPNTLVLSTKTGFSRDYELFPYGSYNTSKDVFFSLEHRDDRLHEKELTYGVLAYDKAKAYPITKLDENFPEGGEFEDTIGGHPVVVTWENNNFSVLDVVKEEEIVPEINFWFSWVAFYPETEVYE